MNAIRLEAIDGSHTRETNAFDPFRDHAGGLSRSKGQDSAQIALSEQSIRCTLQTQCPQRGAGSLGAVAIVSAAEVQVEVWLSLLSLSLWLSVQLRLWLLVVLVWGVGRTLAGH